MDSCWINLGYGRVKLNGMFAPVNKAGLQPRSIVERSCLCFNAGRRHESKGPQSPRLNQQTLSCCVGKGPCQVTHGLYVRSINFGRMHSVGRSRRKEITCWKLEIYIANRPFHWFSTGLNAFDTLDWKAEEKYNFSLPSMCRTCHQLHQDFGEVDCQLSYAKMPVASLWKTPSEWNIHKKLIAQTNFLFNLGAETSLVYYCQRCSESFCLLDIQSKKKLYMDTIKLSTVHR